MSILIPGTALSAFDLFKSAVAGVVGTIDLRLLATLFIGVNGIPENDISAQHAAQIGSRTNLREIQHRSNRVAASAMRPDLA